VHHPIFRLMTEQVVIDRIKIDTARNTIDASAVPWLMESIGHVGLTNPIIVTRPSAGMGVYLVTGRNRLEACRRLGYTTITSRVEQSGDPRVMLWAELVHIEDNLMRMRPAEKQKMLARRQSLILQLAPLERKKAS
jgi:uncharacterized ParB-like nuclease family protein